MGDDPRAVVDSRLRDVANFQVVDASVLPRMTKGKINVPTNMVTEKQQRWFWAVDKMIFYS